MVLYRNKTSERPGTKRYNLYAFPLSKDTMVTGQGKRTPIMVYADHTVQSERTEVLQKLNLMTDLS
jgi:hypothetical protein